MTYILANYSTGLKRFQKINAELKYIDCKLELTSPRLSAAATSQPESLLADGSSDTNVGAVLSGRGRQLLMGVGGGVLGDLALLDGAENLAD